MRLYCHNCERRVNLRHAFCPVCRSRLIIWYVYAALVVIALLVLATLLL